MYYRLAISALATVLAFPACGVAVSGPQQPQAGVQTEEIPAVKRELLDLIARLKPKLPPELSRRLAVISMKIATGWCSPYLTEEFEKDLNARPADERSKFEADWKRVRAHPAWPVLKPPEPSGQTRSKKST